jgi:hypothetical protein
VSFRCSATQACTLYKTSYQMDLDHMASSFVSQYDLLCQADNLEAKQIFALLATLIIVS